jgi:hypothetical protein
MIRIVIGSVVGGAVMFVVGFIFWATPLAALGYSHAGEAQSAAVQTALAQNLSHTGRYIVPDVTTQGGTVLYGRGPVATVDYNSKGYATTDNGSLIGGLVQEIVVVLMFGLALLPICARVPDFESRARVVVGISAAAAVMIALSDPIFEHADWRFAIYAVVADIAMLAAGGLVLARWFLPHAGARTAPGVTTL